MRSIGGLALAATLLSGPAVAASPSNAPMRFEIKYNGGNCSQCTWIHAEGVIDRDTPKRFEEFVAKYRRSTSDSAKTVVLHSPGGNLLGGMRLGEAIRRQGLDTRLADDGPKIPGKDAYADLKSECYSACAYAFLGGVNRYIDKETRLGVHQFYSLEAVKNFDGKQFSGRDLSDQQRVYALLSDYVRAMGVDVRLVEVAATVPPNAPIRFVTEAEAAAWRIDTTSPPPSRWEMKPYTGGVVATIRQLQGGGYQGYEALLHVSCRSGRPGVLDFTFVRQVPGHAEAYARRANLEAEPVTEVKADDTLVARAPFGGVAALDANLVSFSFAVGPETLKPLRTATTLSVGVPVSRGLEVSGRVGGYFPAADAADMFAVVQKNCLPS